MATEQHNAPNLSLETPEERLGRAIMAHMARCDAEEPSALDLLIDLESPLAALNTRLEFLAQYFEKKGATMPDGALYLFLWDCLEAAREAQQAWSEAWEEAGHLRLVPKAAA